MSKVNGYTFKGNNSVKIIFATFLKMVKSKGNWASVNILIKRMVHCIMHYHTSTLSCFHKYFCHASFVHVLTLVVECADFVSLYFGTSIVY